MSNARHACRLVVAVTAAIAAPAAADDGFYKGKTISILMGTGPGGSYDLYGRTIAEHIARHIPGQPTVIVEHMPGAGGVIAANHIYNTAPQDGTRMLLAHAIPLVEKLEPSQGVRFEFGEAPMAGHLRFHRAGADFSGTPRPSTVSRSSRPRRSSSVHSTRRT